DLSPAYDRAALGYLLQIARHWPADLLIRVYASVRRVVELPFQVRLYTAPAPPAVAGSPLGAIYEMWIPALGHLSGLGAIAVGAGLLAAAGSDCRIAAWLLAAVVSFGGYPALQFDARHFFFLEALPWIAFLSIAAWIRRRGIADAGWQLRRAAIFGAAAAAIVVLPLVALRAYQQAHVARLFDGYLHARAENLALSPAAAGPGRVLLRAAALDAPPAHGVRAEYLVADVSGRACGRAQIPVTLHYDIESGYTDLSRTVDVRVPSGDEPYRLFFPAYYAPGSAFGGVELAASDRGCLDGLRRVTDLSEIPLLLTVRLDPGWRG